MDNVHPINATELTLALRKLLGGGYQEDFNVLPQKDEGGFYWFQIKRESDGLTLWIESDGKDKIKVSICSINGSDAAGSYSFPYRSTSEITGLTASISMSRTKTIDQIAKDIVRRLLPDATTFQAVANKQFKEHQDFMNQQSSNRDKVLALATPAFPVKPYGQSLDELNIYNKYPHGHHLPALPIGDCKIRVQSSGYQLTFDVPHAFGIKLLEIYKQFVEEAVKNSTPPDEINE